MAAQRANFLTGDAAFAVNQGGEIELWNTEAEKLFGYTAHTALGQKCWNLLAGQDSHGNRYCSEFCPLREMASRHESVHSFSLSFKTASEGRKKIPTSYLQVYKDSGDGLLLHICHEPLDEADTNGHESAHYRPVENSRGRGLTQRELDVLALLADSKTTEEIASTLCISQATVRNHVHHILTKLHVHNRLEAILIGQRIDLI